MPSKQELLAAFYNVDNVITINVTMAADDWKKLLEAKPKGGFDFVGPRYEWLQAASVTIKGTKTPKDLATFTTVGIIKKSFAGSFSTTKPSIRLDFSRFNEGQEDRIENLLGLKTLTLNNSKQDQSFVRQIVGYDIIRQAGLPYPRCNYARVFVNGTDYGVYVNLEPFKKAFIQRNFNNNDKGNLYELEHPEDLATATLSKGRISFEGLSKFENLDDLRKAIEKLRQGFAAASQVVDMDNFIRFQAIEALFKHWDGYGIQRNNTYVYNDTVAVEKPDFGNVKLKFIPSGIDQTFQEDRDFIVGALGRVSGLVINDPAAKNKLRETIRQLADTIFGAANLENAIFPLMSRLEKMLRDNGAPAKTPEEIAALHKQLAIVRSGAYQLLDEFPAAGALWVSKASGTALGVDSTTPMGPGAGAFDVAHGSGSQPWVVAKVPGKGTVRLKSKALDTLLHADGAVKTAGGKLKVYTAKAEDAASEFVVQKTGLRNNNNDGGPWRASGYFVLQSAVTKQFVSFGEEVNAKGKKQVVQVENVGDATQFYLA